MLTVSPVFSTGSPAVGPIAPQAVASGLPTQQLASMPPPGYPYYHPGAFAPPGYWPGGQYASYPYMMPPPPSHQGYAGPVPGYPLPHLGYQPSRPANVTGGGEETKG